MSVDTGGSFSNGGYHNSKPSRNNAPYRKGKGKFRNNNPTHKAKGQNDTLATMIVNHSSGSEHDDVQNEDTLEMIDDFLDNEYTQQDEEETTLDMGTIGTADHEHNLSRYATPRTITTLHTEITDDNITLYDDDMNDIDNINSSHTEEVEQWDDDQSYDHEVEYQPNGSTPNMDPMMMGVSGPMQFGQKGLPIITPLPDDAKLKNGMSTGQRTDYGGIDEYGDYDDNYEQYYDDIEYAQDPPKKKKYRESDASIKPPSYEEAKDLTEKENREKHEKRYSKYDNFYDRTDLEDSKEDSYDKTTADLTDNVQSGSTKSIGGRRKGKGKGKKHRKNKSKHKNKHKKNTKSIELSVTSEIDDNAHDGSHYSRNTNVYAMELSVGTDLSTGGGRKELSLYYNKKTQDKYDKFEMNTYSTDTDSDSDRITKKYLNQPITPAPEEVGAKYNPQSATDNDGYTDYHDEEELDEDDMGYLPKSNNVSFNNKVYKEQSLSPSPKPPRILAKKSDIEAGHHKETAVSLNVPSYGKGSSNKSNKSNKSHHKKKKKFTLKDFMSVDLEQHVLDNDSDNFDIAKAICKLYDEKTGDTDTVTIVADTQKGPNTAYWSKGDYNRVEKNCLGKYIMVYRACKHVEGTIKVKQDIFESCVKGLCMDNLGHSQLIADKLDCVFGEGCHVSLASHDDFEVFCRYSDGYICEVELPSGDFVVAWRR